MCVHCNFTQCLIISTCVNWYGLGHANVDIEASRLFVCVCVCCACLSNLYKCRGTSGTAITDTRVEWVIDIIDNPNPLCVS